MYILKIFSPGVVSLTIDDNGVCIAAPGELTKLLGEPESKLRAYAAKKVWSVEKLEQLEFAWDAYDR